MSNKQNFLPGYQSKKYAQYAGQVPAPTPVPTIPPKNYYYTVTGQAIKGDNKSFSEFNYTNARFKINEHMQNRTQGEAWNDLKEEDYKNQPNTTRDLYNIEELWKQYSF